MRLYKLLLLLLIPWQLAAQKQSYPEKLRRSINTADKVTIYTEWAYSLEHDPDSAIAIATTARRYAQQQKAVTSELEALAVLCDLSRRQKNIPEADRYFATALQLAAQHKLPGSTLDLYYFMAGLYSKEKQYAAAKTYYEKGYALARTLKRTDYQFQYFNDLGNISNAEGNYAAAESFFKDGINYARSQRDTFRMHVGLNNLAGNYSSQNDYEKSVACYLESLRLKELQGDEVHMMPTLCNLVRVYNTWKKPEMAMSYAERALLLSKKSKAPEDRLAALAVYADCLDKTGRRKEIKPLALEGVAISKTLTPTAKTQMYTGNLLKYLGLLALTQNNADEALQYYNEALRAWQDAGYPRGEAIMYKNIAELYLQQQQPAKALIYLGKSDTIIKQLRDLELDAVCNKVYSEAYRQSGNLDMALQHYQLYHRLNDSLYRKETHQQIAELETRYQTRKKEQTIESLHLEQKAQALELSRTRQRQWLIGITAGVVALLLSVSVLANIKIRKQRRLLSTQNTALDELNKVKTRLFSIISHDLRGLVLPLQTAGKLMSYQVQKENYTKAADTASELQKNAETLAALLDNLLYWSATQLQGYVPHPEPVNPSAELDHLTSAFEGLARVRQVQLEKELPEGLNLMTDKGGFLVIFRNLIANALKFTPAQGRVKVSAERKGDKIHITVSDTGPGMPSGIGPDLSAVGAPVKQDGGERGIGLGLELVRQFTRLNHGVIDMRSEQGKGTIISIAFPISLS